MLVAPSIINVEEVAMYVLGVVITSSPSPIPNESPSEPPKSWLWQVAQAILRFADKILS